MSRWFLATLPLVGGEPKLPPIINDKVNDGRVTLVIEGSRFSLKENPDEGQATRRELRSLQGAYLGRLDEGQFGTTGRPAVIICTGSKTAFEWLRARTIDPDSGEYQFKSLGEAWQITAVRRWLKNDLLDGLNPLATTRIPWIAGEFGPVPGSTYGRPTLPIVYCGQNHDPFAPEVP